MPTRNSSRRKPSRDLQLVGGLLQQGLVAGDLGGDVLDLPDGDGDLVASNDTINLITTVPFVDMWSYVAVIFAIAGMLIGVGGSLSAISKFLQA